MKTLLLSFLLCLSFTAAADVAPVGAGSGTTTAAKPAPEEKFSWLVQVTSTHGTAPNAQRISGFGFILRDPKTEKFYVATASHLSQGANLRIERTQEQTGAAMPVSFRASVAHNLSDVEVFEVKPWKGIVALADVQEQALVIRPGVREGLMRANNLRGENYLPVGLTTYIPRSRPRASDFSDFYLLGQNPNRMEQTGGVDATFLKNYFRRGFAPVRFEALSHSPFAPGMSGLPVIELGSNYETFHVVGVVSGRCRYHRHGWFVQTYPILKAVETLAAGAKGRARDEVEWKIHFGPEDYVLYRSGKVEGTSYRFEEILPSAVATGEGSRSDSGGGDRSDSGGGGRSDSGGGGRSDSGDGPQAKSSYESLGLSSGMAFASGNGPLLPAVAFLTEAGGRTTLLVANVASLRAVEQIESKARYKREAFSLRAIGPTEPLLPLMLAHYKTHSNFTEWQGKQMFPLISHWIFQEDKLTGIGTLWIDLQAKGNGATMHLDYGEGEFDLELTAQGTLKGTAGGFRPILEARSSKGELCQLNLGAVLMANPELQENVEKPQAKATITCPEFQLYGEQYMGPLE